MTAPNGEYRICVMYSTQRSIERSHGALWCRCRYRLTLGNIASQHLGLTVLQHLDRLTERLPPSGGHVFKKILQQYRKILIFLTFILLKKCSCWIKCNTVYEYNKFLLNGVCHEIFDPFFHFFQTHLGPR